MGYRMPSPELFLPIVLIAALGSGISIWLFNTLSSTSPTIREEHTKFAISQMVGFLGELEDEQPPVSTGELIKALKESSIDWNSCRIDGNQILDGWGRPMSAAFDPSTATWTFRSSGRDGRVGTGDDIEATTPRSPNGESGRSGD
jgi:hypothetical protein